MVTNALQIPKRPITIRRRPQAPPPPQVHPSLGVVRLISEVFVATVKVGVYLPIAAVVITVMVALVQRVCFPQCLAVVQEFEISPEVAKRVSLSGKTAANMVIDILNQHASDGARFHGSEYYTYDAAGAQSIALEQSMKVPVQSSYGIEVKGISIDTIVKVYNWIRNREWSIGGDITAIGDQVVVTLRVNQDNIARYWQITDPGKGDGGHLIQEATEAMLADQNPELLGRSFLQEHQYDRAVETFRNWTLNDPRDWKPSYYLSLAYDYQGKVPEALTLARWSRGIALQEKTMKTMISKKPPSSNTATPAELADVTDAVGRMNNFRTTESLPKPEAPKYLSDLGVAEKLLKKLTEKNPSNANYTIQLARVLDREADVQLKFFTDIDHATANEKQAIALLDKAISQAPENGGLHELRSMFLQRVVDIAIQQHVAQASIADLKSQVTDGFRLALELRPTNSSPLWGAVYGLIDRHENQDAIDLAHAILLLQPKSTPAEVAYTVALAFAKQPEARQHLPALLAKADKSELEALSNGFQAAGDSDSLSQIGNAGK